MSHAQDSLQADLHRGIIYGPYEGFLIVHSIQYLDLDVDIDRYRYIRVSNNWGPLQGVQAPFEGVWVDIRQVSN